MSNEIQFYQNGHVTLVNPDFAQAPAPQFLRAVRASDRAAPDEDSLGGDRVSRREWALSRASGLITTPQATQNGCVFFSNNTADRDADLGKHRSPGDENSHPAKELFFMASTAQPSGGILGGWILEGFNLALPPLPASGDLQPLTRTTRANLLLPAEGPKLKFKKFHYSSSDGDLEQVTGAISQACQTFLAAGWSEGDVLDVVALPAMYAATTDGNAWGYAAVVGTVQVPAAALEGAAEREDGVLPVPLLMNLQFDRAEELHCSLCCVLRRVDARALGSLPAGAPYPLVVSAVVEGANYDDIKQAAEMAHSFVEENFEALVEEVRGAGRAGPGDDEEIAQEIARMVLADSWGLPDAPDLCSMSWTQFSTFAFMRAAFEKDERLGQIASRVREVILVAAALRAVRPLPGKTAYELYLEWSKVL